MLKVGDTVTLLRDTVPWYSGYGANPSVTLPAGTIGTVQAVNVPPVRGTARTPSYCVARFTFTDGPWQVSFHPGDGTLA